MNCKYLLALLPLLSIGCYLDENTLNGHWKAVGFYENGERTEVPLDSVKLYFHASGTYYFSSIGRYSESGLFRTSMHYLLLTDTTVTPARDHILKVEYLSKDSLKLKMELDGNDQLLIFSRN